MHVYIFKYKNILLKSTKNRKQSRKKKCKKLKKVIGSVITVSRLKCMVLKSRCLVSMLIFYFALVGIGIVRYCIARARARLSQTA